MIKILPETQSDLLAIRAEDKLTTEDYENIFVPQMNKLIEKYGKVRVLLIFSEDFKGWELGALWEDAKVGLHHRNDFSKIAVVTDKKWLDWTAQLGAIIMNGQLKTFDPKEIENAFQWIQSKD